MFSISRLKIRNFKSFKAADVKITDEFICFAGPNGSGKSNVMDAIRFAMGETSLRSLRAKKVRDLIHAGAKTAEVTVTFTNGGEQTEIKRAINQEGKILYRLNGKRTTRGAIQEALRKHNLDSSGRNTIAQGEVQRLINMNGKERRLIIDNVAGIADFEEKKKEAMRELDTVDTRIKDAQLVLGERKAFLTELGKEKEVAVKYQASRKTLTNAKGTLLKAEIERHEKELAELLGKEEKLKAEMAKAQEGLDAIAKEIAEVDSKRQATSEELQSKQRTNALIRRLEELKASTGSRKQVIEDRQESIEKSMKERKAIEGKLASEEEAIAALEKGSEGLLKELGEAEARLSSHGGGADDEATAAIRRRLYEQEQALGSSKEKLITLSSDIGSKKEIIQTKKEEWEGIAPEAGQEDNASGNPEVLREEVRRMMSEIDASFQKTKEINREIAELDREMLELKEKASIYKVRSSPKLANPALSLISEMNDPGIYGIMADLIQFEPRYAHAVEAAGGSRLLYVVVDSVDTATRTIDKLKKAKAGRATFIPLDAIKTPRRIEEGGFSSVLDVVDCKAQVRRAAEYLFADTLLVDKASEAKALGIGNARMVTLDGEIFERSGIVSGGRAQSSILSGNQLRKIEDELSQVKSRKESLIQELYSIREEESRLRAEKSRVEIELKTMEMRKSLADEKRKDKEQAAQRKGKLSGEIRALEEAIKSMEEERAGLSVTVSRMHEELAASRESLEKAEAEFRKRSEESSKERADLSGAVSGLRTKIEGKRSEIRLRSQECASKREHLERLATEEKESAERIAKERKLMEEERSELTELEGKISSASKAIEKLFERMKGFELELQALGERRGEGRMRLDRLTRDMNQLEIKRATTTTRLEDIRAEFSEFGDIEYLEEGKDELTRMIAEAERTLAGLGNVNMAAIEMYDRRKAEIDDVEERIKKLDKEREAILSMINEIEEHKKEAFFETFDAVNEKFTHLFDYINIGKGHLYLNAPSNPFESGLFIKLRRKNQEHSLDALSGGEKTLVALMFMFALQFVKPAPFYILDEVDAALDKPNSKNMADLIMSTKDSQFVIVTHNDIVMSNSDSVIGVTKSGDVSKLVGLRLKQVAAA